jgi:dihydroflavonol-4-reductase
MTKTAFVTGATGFIGLNLIEELCKEDWKIHALHRSTSDLTYLKRFDVHRIVGSIQDSNTLHAGMPTHLDAVFHLAGNTSAWSKNNEEQYQDNVIGTRNMLEVALEKKAKKFIYTSSVSSFGIHEERIDENTPSNADTCGVNYHLTKYLAEKEVAKAVEKGLDAVILNPCHVLGPYDKSNWSQLIQAVYRNTLPGILPGVGTFGHVKDVVQAHINAVEKGRTGEKYLLGGVEASFLRVIRTIQKMLDKPLSTKATPVGVLRLVLWGSMLKSTISDKEPLLTPEKFKFVTEKVMCNSGKAQRELDYQTSTLEKMLSDAYGWLYAEGLL